jgi:hypothetical protein
MHNLNDIMALAPSADNTDGALPGEVLSGTTYWSLRTTGSTWGPQTGTMPDNGAVMIMPGTANQTIVAGYHDGTSYVAGDADLATGNILYNIDLFGVVGAYPPAPVPKTGQTGCWDTHGTPLPNCANSGQDGEYQKGVTWPVPRFVTSTTGIVTDTLTGLVWL